MQAMSKVEGKVSCIQTIRKNTSHYPWGSSGSSDSAQFLLASLDRLVSANQPEAFRVTAKYEPDEKKRSLLFRKGVYPYEYMDSLGSIYRTQLPPKEVFYSKLSDEHISDGDYGHAQKVWETFGCHNLGATTTSLPPYGRPPPGRYLRDLSENLLTAVWIGSRPLLHQPRLSWDALLKKTGVELELPTDYDQHLFIEKGMRGGISMVRKDMPKLITRWLRAKLL